MSLPARPLPACVLALVALVTCACDVFLPAAGGPGQECLPGGACQSATLQCIRDLCVEAEGICSADGWCWEHPLPQGNNLNDVWVSPAGEVWAVGDYGTVIRFDGRVWRGQRPWWQSGEPIPDFHGIWGHGAQVWVVGTGGAIRRWDGRHWTPETTPTQATLRDVAGTDEENLWAVGEYATVLRRNVSKATWERSSAGVDGLDLDVRAVHARETEVWIAGIKRFYLEGIWQFEPVVASWGKDAWSAAWEQPPEGVDCRQINAIWTAGPGEPVWIGGAATWENATPCGISVLDRRTNLWSRSYLPEHPVRGISGSSRSEVLAVGGQPPWRLYAVYDGARWTSSAQHAEPLYAVYSAGAQSTWAVGQQGALAEWTGGWTTHSRNLTSFVYKAASNTVRGRQEHAVWVVGEYWMVASFNGTKWSVLESNNEWNANGFGSIQSIWPMPEASDGVWLSLSRFRELDRVWDTYITRWSLGPVSIPVEPRLADQGPIHSIYAPDTARLYLVGNGGTAQRCPLEGPCQAIATGEAGTDVDWKRIFGWGTDDFVMVGSRGLLLRCQGVESCAGTQVGTGDELLRGVWGAGPERLFVVSALGNVYRVDDSGVAVEASVSEPLHDVFGAGEVLLAAGEGGLLLQRSPDGVWTTQQSGTNRNLTGVWVWSDGNRSRAWVAGEYKTLLHRRF